MIRQQRIWILLILVLVSGSCGAAPRVFVDSRSTTRDPNDIYCGLMLRELPRQALIVALSDDLGVACLDATMQPDATAKPDDIILGVDRQVDARKRVVKITLYDGQNNVLDSSEIPVEPVQGDETGYVILDNFAKPVVELAQTKWIPLVAQRLSKQPTTRPWNPSQPAPQATTWLLRLMDFQHAFLAARLTHQAIAESGESPEQLGTLIRAYTNLGDGTRHLMNGQSAAMYARALVYAERLTRLAPDDPSSWWHKAYCEAIYGLPRAAEADLKHGDELAAGKNPPSWVPLVRQLLAFDTQSLFDGANGDDAALAAYFAMLTVEDSPLPSLPINFSRLALAQNPEALRAIHMISLNGGVGILHGSTQQASRALNRLIASLATEDTVTKSVRDTTQRAIDDRFSVDAINKLLATLQDQPLEPGQLLSWSDYVATVRDCYFINAVRRLFFVRWQWAVGTRGEIAGWTPLLKQHRYFPIITSFGDERDAARKLAAIPFKDDTLSADLLAMHFLRLGLPKPAGFANWTTRYIAQMDGTAHDLAEVVWEYRFSTDEEGKADRLMRAKELERICPDHPVALAEQVMRDWPSMKSREAKLAETADANPIVAYALGHAYAQQQRYDDANHLLRRAAVLAPDKTVYAEIANVHWAQHDEEGWVKTWDEYLAKVEDLGLDHAQVGTMVSSYYLDRNEFEKALPYAKLAADSYSGWGLEEYARVLTCLGRYDEAAAIMNADVQRYGMSAYGSYYKFCQLTGRGDLKLARRLAAQYAQYYTENTNIDVLRDIGVYDALEHMPDEAVFRFQKAFDQEHNPFDLSMIVINQVEQKQTDEAQKALDQILAIKQDTPRTKSYAAFATEMKRLLADPKALPARDGEIGALLIDKERSLQRGNIAYLFGKYCELRGQNDEAKWWYRTSLQTRNVHFGCRPMAASALRHLGEEYFK